MDPPLHEFIPNDEKMKMMGFDEETLQAMNGMRNTLHEQNPMMGHRGCRLSITHPELCAMQVRAIINAACDAKDSRPKVKIMIPLVVDTAEVIHLKELIDDIAEQIIHERKIHVDYAIGVMIETPAAALIAGELANHAEFFSFGTNDLTQLTFAFSRDDAGKFLTTYLDKKILKEDPFVSIDEKRVGELVKFAVLRAREVNPNLSIGICGEHGGDPKSVTFFNSIGLNYVSCSPYRVPEAALAAAQAQINETISDSIEAEA
jgi:pyruvate,orthophosphate dikinase